MENATAAAAEFLDLFVWTLGAGLFSLAGLVIERYALDSLLAGEVVVGVWAAVMGLVALYVGVYLIGYDNVLPRLQALVNEA